MEEPTSPDASALPIPKWLRPRPDPSPLLAPATAGSAAQRRGRGSVVTGLDGQSEVPTLVMHDAVQGLKSEAIRLKRQSSIPDALKKLRASRQLEVELASAGDKQARDALIEQAQRVSGRVLLAIERTASEECIAAVEGAELEAGDLVDETLLEVHPPGALTCLLPTHPPTHPPTYHSTCLSV